MSAVHTYLRMTRTPLLWVFHSLWSYSLDLQKRDGFPLLGLGLERTISMFDSFFRPLPSLRFVPIFSFRDEPLCPPHRLIGVKITCS
jgi:hypothetical protein